jgi:hypothetical protein
MQEAADFKSDVSTNFTIRASGWIWTIPETKTAPTTTIGGAVRSIRLEGGGATRSRTGLDGFAIRCITALLSRHAFNRRFLLGQNSRKKGKLEASLFENWSGKRVSNSRPQPWQGCALPTELFPRFKPSIIEHFSGAPQGSRSMLDRTFRRLRCALLRLLGHGRRRGRDLLV